MQIERKSRLLWASAEQASLYKENKGEERRPNRSAAAGRTVGRESHLSGSSLVATLSYQGHLSVWALHFQFNHLGGLRDAYFFRDMPKCELETFL